MNVFQEEYFKYRMDRNIIDNKIKEERKVMLDKELEKAHKDYLREKRRIIANLQGLKIAIRVIAKKQGVEINDSGVIRILNNTIEFIKKGEV